MKPLPFKSKTTPWRVLVRAKLSPDKKRKAHYFKTKADADKFCSDIKLDGRAAVFNRNLQRADQDSILLDWIRERLGEDSNVTIIKAIEHYEKTKLNIRKRTVREAFEEFQAWRKSRVSLSTWKSDNDRLILFVRIFHHRQISDLTSTDLRKFFDGLTFNPRSIYKSMRVFFGWAVDYNLLAENPMAVIKPVGEFGVNNQIYDIGTFRRTLRICAGLEPINPGEMPTRDFIGLLPWIALSGFLGLRTHEAMRVTRNSDAIRWSDLYLDREQPFVEIREEVGKNGMRPIETRECLEAFKAWLPLFPYDGPFVCRWTKSKIQKLKAEFTLATKLDWTENGFRNSWASYLLSINGPIGVGRLALEMGNSEGIAKRHYIRKLLSGAGKAWFDLRPDGMERKIIQMEAAG